MSGMLERAFQTLRRVHVVGWRVRHALYWNAHAGTSIPWQTRIAPGGRILLETRGTVRLGRGCQLCHHTVLAPYGGSITLGERVFVGEQTILYGHGGLTIGDDTMIGPLCAVVPMSHGIERTDVPIAQQAITQKGIRIGRDCWLGAGVKVLDGVEIGDGCVIGAGAVVRESLPPYTVAVGVPAKIVARRGELGS
jgi:acetyltransferase-like isoleucine patch superfamily enzyme